MEGKVYEVIIQQWSVQVIPEWGISQKQPDGTFESVSGTNVYLRTGQQLQATNELGAAYLEKAEAQGILKEVGE